MICLQLPWQSHDGAAHQEKIDMITPRVAFRKANRTRKTRVAPVATSLGLQLKPAR
jgi:hypothetical protein